MGFGDALGRLLQALRSEPTAQRQAIAAAETIQPRVLLIVFDPPVDAAGRLPLSRHMRWNNVDELIAGYISDLAECSGGYLQYQVVERIDVAEFPPKADGFRYDATGYLGVLAGRRAAHQPDLIDYDALIARFDLLSRVESADIDEVWVFAFPYAGLYESRMAGRAPFWCNAPPLEGTGRCRRFVIMGFSYERGVGEMLENFGHRAESILSELFRGTSGEANLYARFTRYDKIDPGRAEVGTIHFAPNSERDYDWGNRRYVQSGCDRWYAFPDLQAAPRMINCAEWGGGDIRRHHRWWLDHLPRAAGHSGAIANNWWRYIVDPGLV